MNNTIQQKVPFSVLINSDLYKKAINNTLNDPKRAERFIANLVTLVTNNSDLGNCDVQTILAGALLGETLNLSPSPQLGHFYLIPFNDTKNNRITATFVIGYKGLLQLALRSGAYKNIDVIEVKKGELIKSDIFKGEYEFEAITDDIERENTETVGYYCYIKYHDGFNKEVYWSKDKMKSHATRYSKLYASDVRNNRKSSKWSTDFDAMAKKTMLRQIISKWGIMSTEIAQVIEKEDEVEYSNIIDIDTKKAKNQVNKIEISPQIQQEFPQNQPEYISHQVNINDL